MARGRGRPFERGASGNPAGRPRGAKNVMPRVREVVDEVHEANLVNIKAALGRVATSTRTALQFQDLRARLNKEIGQGSGEGGVGGITINFISNVDPTKLLAARSRALPLLHGPTQNSQETA